MIKLLTAITIFCAPLGALAFTISPIVDLGFDFGGEKLVEVTYTDGSSSNIEAGRGLLISGGALFQFADSFELQTTLGMKWTTVKQAKNGAIDFTRWPAEIIAFFRPLANQFRIGAGGVYQFNNELKGTQDASVASTKFKNTVGAIVQSDYFFGDEKNLGVGVRYTSIKYETETAAGSANGSSIGVYLTYVWN